MIILRVKTDEGTKTFTFQQPIIPGTTPEQAHAANLEGANKAAYYVMRTSAAGFIAEVESVDSTNGKILKKWDHKKHLYGNRFVRKLSYTIKDRAYSDTEWAVLGTEEDCLKMADETNKKATCWASVTCHIQHIVGPLWQTVFCDPYKD